MKIPEKDFWANGKGTPLAFFIPGSTGTKRPAMCGYDAMAAAFWLKGFSVQVFVSSGQEGHDGKYSLGLSLSEAEARIHDLLTSIEPSMLFLVGACAGGAVASHLAARLTNCPLLMALWETPMRFTDENHNTFIKRAAEIGIPIDDDYWANILNLDTVASRIKCPVHIGYGDATVPALFSALECKVIKETMRNTVAVEECFIAGANHDLPRGSSSMLLNGYLSRLFEFYNRRTRM